MILHSIKFRKICNVRNFHADIGPNPAGTPSRIIKNIREASDARPSRVCYVPQSVASALSTICDIFGVLEGLVIVDSGATESVGSPEAPESVSGSESHAPFNGGNRRGSRKSNDVQTG